MFEKLSTQIHILYYKLLRFEFWPFWIFYFPMYFYGIYLALRARSSMYFSTANPGMKYSGVMGESKYKVLRSIPEKYIPKTVLLQAPIGKFKVQEIVNKKGFSYPFIIKPDVGERGKDVELLHSEADLVHYLHGKSFDLNIQEFIGEGLEFGVMYHRMPGEDRGEVTSVVEKGFLTVVGDGVATLEQLIKREIRASSRLDYLLNKHEKEANKIIPQGKAIKLEPIGNHCRGTTFFNANKLINEQLNVIFNKIALQVDGFYYGRFDLKVPTLEDLYDGRNIKIIELNGVSSEVAHIYDPDYKLLDAYRDVARHMRIIYKIASINHSQGFRYDSLRLFLIDLKNHLTKN